jgi:phospholipase/lecithinase/hemolysin
VTDSIADGVSDLLDLGVTKVLVNLMQPMGCSPRYTRTTTNYTECINDDITEAHNRMIQDKLGSEDSVLLLDLHKAFIQTIHPKTGTGFWHRHIPCCESFTPAGYCGQVDRFGLPQYKVCDEPDKYFYFDDWHPTQAGWKAIMDRHLGDPIKEFLDIH